MSLLLPVSSHYHLASLVIVLLLQLNVGGPNAAAVLEAAKEGESEEEGEMSASEEELGGEVGVRCTCSARSGCHFTSRPVGSILSCCHSYVAASLSLAKAEAKIGVLKCLLEIM